MTKLRFLVVTGCLFFAAMSVNAQTEYKPFRLDLGLGYAIANDGAGVVFNLEPKYTVIPRLNVGLKLEWAWLVRDINFQGMDTGDAKLQGMSSYLATADYHLTQKSFRPFVGAGLGIYQIASASFGAVNSGATTNFGVMLRAGFDVRHFRMALAYNMAGKDDLDINTGHFSFTIGAYIGGGKR